MHIAAPQIQAATSLPLLHIADPTAERIKAAGLRRVGLLGTAFTMEKDFYKGRLAQEHGLEVLVPEPEDRATVHRIIYSELVQGQIVDASRLAYRKVIAGLVARGAEAIIALAGHRGLTTQTAHANTSAAPPRPPRSAPGTPSTAHGPGPRQ
jgi:aspartate racemase